MAARHSVNLLALAVRCLVAYWWLLVLLRLDGKRGIGQAGAFNFVMALILGNMVDDVLWSEVSVPVFFTATAALVSTHVAVATVACRSARVHHLVNGRPVAVISSGAFTDGLRRERIRRAEMLGVLRTRGIEDPRDVRTAAVEETGRISVLLEDDVKPVVRDPIST